MFFLEFFKSLMINYPSPKNLSYNWNLGSLLAFFFVFQVFSGMLLVLFYTPSEILAFFSVDFFTRENSNGILIRVIHLNGASFIFIFMYAHVMRGLFFNSYRLVYTWGVGSFILLLTMMSAFLGYVLPFGQMSFWGASVITNLISVIPFVGEQIVQWLWGGFSINQSSLSIFFLLHFLVPLIILVLVLFHLCFLHFSSSTSKTMIFFSTMKLKFFPYFVLKDLKNLFICFFMYSFIFFFPFVLGDPENWLKADPVVSPIHIQPEWYFLFAYAILRCIPNKMGGVIALVLSVIILCLLILNQTFYSKMKKKNKIFFLFFIYFFLVLTWLGSCPVEDPYILMSQIFSAGYFLIYFFLI